MSILDLAKRDIQDITGNLNEFGVAITFTPPTGAVKTVTGLHSKHHMAMDTDGNLVNSRNAHITVSEALLIAAPAYTVRNAAGVVTLKGHKVSVKDSTGVAKNYIIREWFPDETIGTITCILGDFE